MTYWPARRRKQQSPIQRYAPQPARDQVQGAQPLDYMAPQPTNQVYKGGMSSQQFPSGTSPAPLAPAPAFKGWGSSPVVAKTLNHYPELQPSQPPQGQQGHPKEDPPVVPVPVPVPTPEPGPGGLPLSPEFEQARRSLEDELAGLLAQYGVQEQDIAAALKLTTARLATDQLLDEDTINQNLAARGIYNSGIRKTDQEQLAANYGRTRQDIANTTAGQYRDLAGRKSQAQSNYNRGLADLMLRLAQWQAENAQGTVKPPTGTPTAFPGVPGTVDVGPVTDLGGYVAPSGPPAIPRDPGTYAIPAIQALMGNDTLGLEDFDQTATSVKKKKKKKPPVDLNGPWGG